MNLIELSHIEKAYSFAGQSQRVLDNVSLSVAEGEFVAIMGSSGSGKSTLMNLIGLLDKPNQGSYLFDGQSTADLSDDEAAALRNRAIGFVFQQFFLLPRMTILDNVSLPLSYQHIDSVTRNERAKQMLIRVGLEEKIRHYPNQLSGGQQQRVAIARALVTAPKVILADEPTGALDSKTGNEVMHFFQELNREQGTTLIIVTHDKQVAEFCQRVIHIRDGVIYS